MESQIDKFRRLLEESLSNRNYEDEYKRELHRKNRLERAHKFLSKDTSKKMKILIDWVEKRRKRKQFGCTNVQDLVEAVAWEYGIRIKQDYYVTSIYGGWWFGPNRGYLPSKLSKWGLIKIFFNEAIYLLHERIKLHRYCKCGQCKHY